MSWLVVTHSQTALDGVECLCGQLLRQRNWQHHNCMCLTCEYKSLREKRTSFVGLDGGYIIANGAEH